MKPDQPGADGGFTNVEVSVEEDTSPSTGVKYLQGIHQHQADKWLDMLQKG
jgi:hypothetical protein